MTATLEKIERYRYLLQFKWKCQFPLCDGKPHVGLPFKHARYQQIVDPADEITAFITGRGFGKTRAGAEWAKDRLLGEPKHRMIIMVPTTAIGRDVCIEGESGLLSVLPSDRVKTWNRSMGELRLTNGSLAKIFSCNTQVDAEAVRGYQSHSFWAEEVGTWRYQQLAWDMARFANRLGQDPKVVVTTTPKPTPVIKRLMKDPTCRVVTGSTFDNADNLAPTFINTMRDTYAGTRLGQQELEGKLLEDVIGALWRIDMIVRADPQLVLPSHMQRILISVDPAGSHKATSDMTGIVVVGRLDNKAYVFEDLTGRYSPNEWATVAIDAYERYSADAIIAEVNFGADMVQTILRGVPGGDRPRFKPVHAARGKQLRAEPVVGLYEQERVVHVGNLPELENQMTTWVPPGQFEMDGRDGTQTPIKPSPESPDRIDALVWGVTELALVPRGRRTMRFES